MTIDPFLAELCVFSFAFPPRGWAQCNGQLLPINQNQALFSLLGTTYGGNGQTTFALPELRGRLAIHLGDGHVLGEQGGAQTVTLNSAQVAHSHALLASANAADSQDPAGQSLARPQTNAYVENHVGQVIPSGTAAPLNPASSTFAGGGQAHLNLSPFLVLNQCIALQGVFPSRS